MTERKPGIAIRRCVRTTRVVIAAAALASCTDPASIGPEPDYLGLASDEYAFYSTSLSNRLPRDSCPPFVRDAGTTVRRGIAGSTATMAFPAGITVNGTAFDGGRGAVFDVAGAGIIAITYAPNFPLFQTPASARPRDIYPAGYENWCSVTVGGRPAALRITQSRSAFTDTAKVAPVQLFLNDMAVTVTNPDGRRVNIRIVAAQRETRTLRQFSSLRIAPLLPIVASLEW